MRATWGVVIVEMMRPFVFVAVFAAGLSVAAAECPQDEAKASVPAHDQLTLKKVTFKDLPDWSKDKHSEAVPSFLKSCAKLSKLGDNDPVGHDGHGGVAKQWRGHDLTCTTTPHPFPGRGEAASPGPINSSA